MGKKVMALFSIFFLILSISAIPAFAEGGVPDPQPTTCGKMPCSFFAGKYLAFGDVDDYSMEHLDKLPKPSRFDNIHSSAFVGGSVAFLAQSVNGSSIMPYKAVITGAEAKYSQFPVAGVTFSPDRKTVYFSKVDHPGGGQFNIELISSGIVNISTYLEISNGTYSTTPMEIGEILVAPRSNSKGAAKVVTIKCYKAGVTKLISGRAPICPKGYKKVK
jgi:hypothetical protein